MKRSLLITSSLGLAALLLATPATAQQEGGADAGPASAAELTRKMQAVYEKTTTFKASFKQTYTDLAAGGEPKVTRGNVYIYKPGRMRWDYYDGKSIAKSMIADGKAFWIYEKEFNQVFMECIADSQLPTSINFLMGKGDLLKDFEVEIAGAHPKTNDPILKLVPKKPTSKYRELRFVIDDETHQVLKTTIYDPYGNTNEIVFDSMMFNKKMNEKAFAFEPPKGVRRLNPQKTCP